MSGIIAVYGLVVAVLIVGQSKFSSQLLSPCAFMSLNIQLSQCHLQVATLYIRKSLYPMLPTHFNMLKYFIPSGFVSLGAGLSVGMGGLAAGYAVGVVGDYCVRGYARENRIFVIMVLILIFAEVLGLYGLIVALILNTKSDNTICQ